MKININEQHNLFALAKKELSQDAIIAWILLGNNGNNFLKRICPSINNSIGNFGINKLILQEESIDILVEVKCDTDLYAIIIEDKTDTYIHDFQMHKYIEKISKKRENKKSKYKKVFFVLFKTGDIYHWENEDYKYWQDQINKGAKHFSADELNKRINGILITDSYTDKDIEFSKDVEVHIEDIYTLSKFKKFLENINDDIILDHYKKYLCNKQQEEDCDKDDYCCVKKAIDERNCDCEELHRIELIMVKPGGGGKREYEYNMLSQKLLNYIEAQSSKVSDNFMILPHIVKLKKPGEKDMYCYKLNCQIIADKKKIHGYVPWSGMKGNQREQFGVLKSKVLEICNDVMNEEQKKYLKSNFNKLEDTENQKNDRLQFYSSIGELNSNNVTELIRLATCIAEKIKQS